VTFTKLDPNAGPVVQNLPVSLIGPTQATVSADVLELAPDGNATLRVYYGEVGNNAVTNSAVLGTVDEIGVYRNVISSGIDVNKTYWVRHSLSNSVGERMSLDFEQFTTPNALQCYAGRAPVTRRSGRSEFTIARRLAYNRHLGEAVQQWAFCSLQQSPWAREYYNAKTAAGKNHHAALRALGNRWLEVLWHCLRLGVRYDEAVHTTNRNHALKRAA